MPSYQLLCHTRLALEGRNTTQQIKGMGLRCGAKHKPSSLHDEVLQRHMKDSVNGSYCAARTCLIAPCTASQVS